MTVQTTILFCEFDLDICFFNGFPACRLPNKFYKRSLVAPVGETTGTDSVYLHFLLFSSTCQFSDKIKTNDTLSHTKYLSDILHDLE